MEWQGGECPVRGPWGAAFDQLSVRIEHLHYTNWTGRAPPATADSANKYRAAERQISDTADTGLALSLSC